ncbi:MAG: pitrilysin family protein [Ancalomicrobiaceae bacterium]|nr:pitrilysin family protein [Ancalomicrobiaceae bacterium]
MTAKVTTLSNGLTVATEAMPHLATASVGVWIGTGSRNEHVGEHGVSHLLEHMAFKGTSRRNAREIAEEIEAVGGEINAATSVETTAYYARILEDDVTLAVDILADILNDSVFDPDELEREQHVIVQEIGAAHDTPEDLVFDRLQECAFPDQAIGRPILGTPETVRSFGKRELTTYLGDNYRGPAMVLAAAGSVRHEAIVDMARERFSGLAEARTRSVEVARYRGGEWREERDLQEAQVTMAFEGRRYTSPDHYAAQVLASTLGGGMSSRLFQEIREKHGLCYSISAFHWAFADTGLFGLHAATGEDDLVNLMPMIVDEIVRAISDISAAEVSRAKAQMRAGMLMSLESPAARAGQLGRQILVHGRPLQLGEILGKIDSVDVDQVRRLAHEVFRTSRPSVALIGPVDGALRAEEIAARLHAAG